MAIGKGLALRNMNLKRQRTKALDRTELACVVREAEAKPKEQQC
jgi:hypothetical protein